MGGMKRLVSLFVLVVAGVLAQAQGNVIFIHPDGTGVNTWGAARMRWVGPDGMLNWDRLERIGVYRGHLKDSAQASSNGGGTAHAYGVRPTAAAFGIDEGKQLVAASGKPLPLMREALQAGLAAGVINSASVTDAGTGVFLAATASRREHAEIARQMLAAGPQVILGGGERWFLPKGTPGRYGEGAREDGKNLIEEARKAGYTVVFTRDELLKVSPQTKKILGLFASDSIFNDQSEEALAEKKLPLFKDGAPTMAENLRVALQVFAANKKQFFLVAEEEGSDNFAGENNASGVLESLRRADEAIGVALQFAAKDRKTLVLYASDSDCAGMQVKSATAGEVLPERDSENGAPIDGRSGSKSLPFLSPADQFGRQHSFSIRWAAGGDLQGGIVARASGYGSQWLPSSVWNTDIYKLMYRVLMNREIRKN